MTSEYNGFGILRSRANVRTRKRRRGGHDRSSRKQLTSRWMIRAHIMAAATSRDVLVQRKYRSVMVSELRITVHRGKRIIRYVFCNALDVLDETYRPVCGLGACYAAHGARRSRKVAVPSFIQRRSDDRYDANRSSYFRITSRNAIAITARHREHSLHFTIMWLAIRASKYVIDDS